MYFDRIRIVLAAPFPAIIFGKQLIMPDVLTNLMR